MSIQEEKLNAIANAIRYAENSTDPIPASDFPQRIQALKGGGTAGCIELLEGYTAEIVHYVGSIRLMNYDSLSVSDVDCQVLEGYV